MKPLPHFFIPSTEYISIPFTDDLETIRAAVDKSAMGAICLTDSHGKLMGICSDADLRKSRENLLISHLLLLLMTLLEQVSSATIYPLLMTIQN